jgi:hypothetical protein
MKEEPYHSANHSRSRSLQLTRRYSSNSYSNIAMCTLAEPQRAYREMALASPVRTICVGCGLLGCRQQPATSRLH